MSDSRTTPGTVQSVDRALRILELLGDEGDGMRLGDVAALADLAPSTCHRLLSTLEERRFAQFDRASSLWRIGPQAYRTGAAFLRKNNLVAPALPVMRTLRDETRETVNIGAPDDGAIVILAQVESRELVRAINVIGGRVALSSSALGKAVLASYDDEALAAHVARHGLPRCTERTITDIDTLRRELAGIRQRGYAFDCEEHFMGLHCVAAPIFGANGDVVAALSVSGLATRLDTARADRLGGIVAEAASTLGQDQGGILPAGWEPAR